MFPFDNHVLPEKRKRDDEGSDVGPSAAPPESNIAENDGMEETIKHAVVLVFRATRAAASFEKMKITRRKTDAEEHADTKTLERLQKEEEVLKEMDPFQVAEYHVYKTLLRVKSIRTSPNFPSFVTEKVKEKAQAQEACYLNVTARLFKTSHVTTAMEKSLEKLYEAAGIREKPVAKKQRLADERARAGNENDPPQHASGLPLSSGTQAKESTEQENVETGRTDGTAKKEATKERRELHEKKSSQAQREVTSSDTDGSASSENTSSEDSSSADSSSDDSTSGSSSDNEDTSSLSTEEVEEAPKDLPKKVKKSARAAEPAAPTTTAFLPSLAGGYFSGSDSEGSEAGGYFQEAPQRKNRRGQRARQAIAELKFGRGANHIKKQQQDRDHGWNMRKGAQEETAGNRKQRRDAGEREGVNGRDKRDSRGDTLSTETKPVKKPAVQKPVHPSWEAAKKKKNEQKTNMSFAGKKTTFD